MQRTDKQSEGESSAKVTAQQHQEENPKTPDIASNTDPEEINAEQNKREYTRGLVRQSRIQIVTNSLIVVFTFFVVLVGYVTQMPFVAPRAGAVTDFAADRPIHLSVGLENIGQTPAYNITVNIGLAVLPFPLNVILPKDPPNVTYVPLTLYSHEPTGVPIRTNGALSKDDAEAIKNGTTNLLFVWGRIHYEDWFGLPHSSDFCFAYGGPSIIANGGIGICTANQGQQYILQTKPQPHAQPNLVPFTPNPPQAPQASP